LLIDNTCWFNRPKQIVLFLVLFGSKRNAFLQDQSVLTKRLLEMLFYNFFLMHTLFSFGVKKGTMYIHFIRRRFQMTAAYLPSILVPLVGLVFPAVAMASIFIYIEKPSIN